VKRRITGFTCDSAGDWIAELECGHRQHVRDQPPFFERPWVHDESERARRVGTPLDCRLCERPQSRPS
jgi:hypothetical protein